MRLILVAINYQKSMVLNLLITVLLANIDIFKLTIPTFSVVRNVFTLRKVVSLLERFLQRLSVCFLGF